MEFLKPLQEPGSPQLKSMTTKTRALRGIVACLVALWAEPSFAEVVFQGYMTTAERSLFVLSVDNTKTSGWLAVGQKFDDISIVAFDARAELLTIETGGKRRDLHLVDARSQTTNAAPSQPTTKPIVILIGQSDRISVGDDVAMLDLLKKKFELVAAMEPQPIVTFQPPGDTTFDCLRLVMDLCRKAGITRFNIQSR
jgi:biopolymer transport protein ExbD